MKKELQDAFGQITMPEACVQEVTKAMEEYQRNTNQRRQGTARRAALALTALAVALVMTVSFNTEARAAVNEIIRFVFGGTSFITMDEETGKILKVVSYPVEESEAAYLESRGGRLYFTLAGETVDITDQTSPETPYIHTYVDGQNVEHMIAIGGTADNFGVFEFYRENVEGQMEWNGWVGGYSENHIDSSTGKPYPWVETAWEELNLPWPVPGA